MLRAVIVRVFADGITLGGVYSPPVEIVPSAALPPTTPFTAHLMVLGEIGTYAVN